MSLLLRQLKSAEVTDGGQSRLDDRRASIVTSKMFGCSSLFFPKIFFLCLDRSIASRVRSFWVETDCSGTILFDGDPPEWSITAAPRRGLVLLSFDVWSIFNCWVRSEASMTLWTPLIDPLTTTITSSMSSSCLERIRYTSLFGIQKEFSGRTFFEGKERSLDKSINR